jgi:predicted SprT family Zn-dependent metalloprotease
MTEAEKELLSKHLPEASTEMVATLLEDFKIMLKIVPPRKSKTGDFHLHPQYGYPIITINADLNPYAFLIVLLHEMAHYKTWRRYQSKSGIRPHGPEWSLHFQKLFNLFVPHKVFPDKLQQAIERHIRKGYASTASDKQLTKLLRDFDKQPVIILETLPAEALFRLSDQRVFVKGPLRRTRYLCYCRQDKKHYIISAYAKVNPV